MDLDKFDQLLEESKLPESTVPLCLRGDLQAEWEVKDSALSDMASSRDRKLSGHSEEEKALAREIQALEHQMQDSTITFRLRALERPDWRKLLEKHPPRKGNEGDRLLGVDQSEFFDALVHACLVEPELDLERVKKLIDKLTDAQFNKLSGAAWELNRRDVDVPFSLTASLITASSGGTSKQRSGSASPSNGSPGGSQRKSQSTSTKKAS